MNRIDLKFQKLKQKNKKAFIAFITAGDPNLEITEQLVLSFEKAGVDIVELGVPFSDPLADGPTIQAASLRALRNNVTLENILKLVTRIRQKSQLPIALMTYYNPVFHYGEKKLVEAAQKSGVDGFIIPDLPPEEGESLIQYAGQHNLSTIFFLAPTTTRERIKKIVRVSTGFIYYVSLTGVTGARQELHEDFLNNIQFAKKITEKPICVGFGISNEAQIKRIAELADGVIVGSAIIKEIEKNLNNNELRKNVTDFVETLVKALKQ